MEKCPIAHTDFEKTKITQCGYVKKKCKKRRFFVIEHQRLNFFFLKSINEKTTSFFFRVIFGVTSFVSPISIRGISKTTKTYGPYG